MSDLVGNASHAAGDERQSGFHSLENDQGRSLCDRGNSQHVERRQERSGVRPESEKTHVRVDTQLGCTVT